MAFFHTGATGGIVGITLLVVLFKLIGIGINPTIFKFRKQKQPVLRRRNRSLLAVIVPHIIGVFGAGLHGRPQLLRQSRQKCPCDGLHGIGYMTAQNILSHMTFCPATGIGAIDSHRKGCCHPFQVTAKMPLCKGNGGFAHLAKLKMNTACSFLFSIVVKADNKRADLKFIKFHQTNGAVQHQFFGIAYCPVLLGPTFGRHLFYNFPCIFI